MAPAERLTQLRKAQRHSARAIPIEAAMVVIAAGAVWVVERFYPLGSVLRLLLVGLPLFALAGDLFNYLRCTLKLRARRHG